MEEVPLLYFVRYIHGYMKSCAWGLFAKVVNGLEALLPEAFYNFYAKAFVKFRKKQKKTPN